MKQAAIIRPIIMHYGLENGLWTLCGREINPIRTSVYQHKPLISDQIGDVDCKRCLVSFGSRQRGANSGDYTGLDYALVLSMCAALAIGFFLIAALFLRNVIKNVRGGSHARRSE
jgi:hypothetical protein